MPSASRLLPLLALAACTRAVVTTPSPTTPARAPHLAAVDALVPAPPEAVGLDADLPARGVTRLRLGRSQRAATAAPRAHGRRPLLLWIGG
jgi:hypothetical protein